MQKRMLTAQMNKAKENALAFDTSPDKQCQGCGAFGKGHRCFYCKRTYATSTAFQGFNMPRICENERGFLYLESGRKPEVRFITDASSNITWAIGRNGLTD